ncbi:UNVERIFIED_CONTAM: hypothetical protein FKN15_016833 [Acipenser sinensis]
MVLRKLFINNLWVCLFEPTAPPPQDVPPVLESPGYQEYWDWVALQWQCLQHARLGAPVPLGREGPRIDPGDVPAGVPPVPENKPLTKEKEGAASSQPEREEPERPQPEREEPERPQPEREEPERPQPEREEPERPQPEWEEPERPQPEWEEPERPQPEREESVHPRPERKESVHPRPKREESVPPPPAGEDYLLSLPPSPPPAEGACLLGS